MAYVRVSIMTLAVVILVCIVSAPLCAGSTGDPEIIGVHFLHGDGAVHYGSNVSLSCRIRNASIINHMLHFHKETGQIVNGVKVWQELSQNEDSNYYPLLPFQFVLHQHGTADADMEYIMIIHRVDERYSGNYSCGVSRASMHFNVNKTAALNVLAEPLSVRLLIDGEVVGENSTVTFNLSSVHTLKCIVNGSNPNAMIQIMHGNQDLTPSANLTLGNGTYGTPEQNSSTPFLVPVTRVTNATIAKWRVDVTYQDAPLTCVARMSDNSMGRRARFMPVVADGPPQFVCRDVHVLPVWTEIWDEYDITCQVYAKPPLTDALFGCETSTICRDFSGFPINTWQPKPDTVYSIFVKNLDAVQNPNSIARGNVTMKLRMNRDALNGRAFYFKAFNSQGLAMHKVTLSAPSGSTRAIASITTILGCILTLLAWQLDM